MNKLLTQVDLSKYSALQASVFLTLDNTVIVAKFQGVYRHGSEGNGDGLFMAATIAAYVAIWNPLGLILDLRELQYEWGNTILKSVNFFSEYGRDPEEQAKRIIIVTTGATRAALQGLESMVKSGERVYCDDLDEALLMAERHVKEFLT